MAHDSLEPANFQCPGGSSWRPQCFVWTTGVWLTELMEIQQEWGYSQPLLLRLCAGETGTRWMSAGTRWDQGSWLLSSAVPVTELHCLGELWCSGDWTLEPRELRYPGDWALLSRYLSSAVPVTELRYPVTWALLSRWQTSAVSALLSLYLNSPVPLFQLRRPGDRPFRGATCGDTGRWQRMRSPAAFGAALRAEG